MKTKIDWDDWNKLETKLTQLESIEIEAGYITPKKHPDADITIAEIATIQQYGSITKNIPERPFMTDGSVLSERKVHSTSVEAVHRFLTGAGGSAVFKPVAEAMKEGIEDAILHQRFKPLSPVTLSVRRSKGNKSTDILIDSGTLLDGVETKINSSKGG